MPSTSSTTDQQHSQWMRYPDLHDRFEFVQLLGEGAGGIVFRVRDRLHDFDEVALKILLNEEAFDEQTVRRFKEELKISQQLCHPSAIRGFDVIETPHTLAFTMELVDGLDLGKIFRQRALSEDEIDYIFTQVLGALRELHGKGVLHRDIKLENIMVSENGDVKLSDLGLSKQYGVQLTRTGVLLGTAQYLPPEYIRKGRFDARGDIYALGVALFELFYGKRWMVEYSGAEAIEVLLETNFAIPVDELRGVAKKYKYIIKRCVALAVEQRFQSAQEVIEAFKKPRDYNFTEPSIASIPASGPVVDDTVVRVSAMSSAQYQRPGNLIVKVVLSVIAIVILTTVSLVATLAIPSVRAAFVEVAHKQRNKISPQLYDYILKLPVPTKR